MEWTAQRKSEDKGESGEASAEIESGGRRKEIADEAIRQAVCGSRKTEATAWNCGNKKDMVVSTEKLRLFLFYGNCVA